MSHVVDWRDRSTCILFGDGAGAVVPREQKRGGCLSRRHIRMEAKGDVLTGCSRHRKDWDASGAGEGRLYSDGWTERI
ncbi:MAG: hypothetical protein ACLUJR_12930 [Mediterraneibacter gnavus]